VAHPTKMQKVSETSDKFRVPTLYDIAGSAHFYNKADNGITVYRDDPSVFVHVQKIRFKHIGKKGVAEFAYDHHSGRYTECQSMN
jgi:twinkle protein